MANIIDVAKEAGVSVATVSYVLSKKKYVSDELTERVWAAVEKLGYKTNYLARGLRNKQTNEIGVVLQNIKNIFFVQLLSGLEEKIQEHGYNLIFFDTGYNIEREKEAIASLRNRWVDGIILYSCVSEDYKEEYYNEFLAPKLFDKKIPLVSIDRVFQKVDGFVTCDYKKGAYDATKHLILSGKKNVMHISGRDDWEVSHARTAGYVEAMKEFGLEKNILIKCGNFKPVDSYEICKELLSGQFSVDGIYAGNDRMAIGCIKAIKERGLIIPDDIAIVGHDNMFFSTLIEPTLTTVNVPRYAMGVAAAELLLNSLKKGGSEEENAQKDERILPPNLIVRQSTDIRGERNWDLYGW